MGSPLWEILKKNKSYVFFTVKEVKEDNTDWMAPVKEVKEENTD